MNTKENDDAHLKLLKLVERDPSISQRKLAKEMGVSLGKAHYCLQELLKIGLIKAGNFAKSEQKKNYAYLITPRGVKEKAIITARFLASKQEQYESLKTEIEQLEKIESYKMKPSDIIRSSRDEVIKIALSHNLTNVRVFGSVLHGTDTEGSDLDLLVDPTPVTTLMNLGAMRSEMKRVWGFDVDILTPGSLPKKWRSEVLAEARPI